MDDPSTKLGKTIRLIKSLCDYCREGNIQQVENLLRSGEIDLNSDVFGNQDLNPLRCAAKIGNIEIVKILLKFGSKLNTVTTSSKTPLEVACKNGNYEIVEILINSGADVSGRGYYTPLYYAVVGNHLRIAKLLLKEGANYKDLDKIWSYFQEFKRPLSKQNLDIVELLLNHKTVCMERLLYHSVMCNDLPLLQILMDKGVDINHSFSPNRMDNYCSPLSIAIQAKHVGIVKLLLESGADSNFCQRFHYEIWFNRHFDKESLDIVKLLFEHKTFQSLEPLLSVAVSSYYNGHESLLQFVVDNGVNINAKFESGHHRIFGKTPLGIACQRGNVQKVEILLKSGANPNIEDDDGETPLMVASNISIVQMLLKFGADINRRDKEGKTALDYCRWKSKVIFDDKEIEIFGKITTEISKMKSCILNNYGLTLYDILIMNSHDLSRYVNNINLKAILKNPNFGDEFMMFGEQIKKKFQQGSLRKEIVEHASQYLQELSGVEVPKLILNMIFKYFSDHQIKSAFLVDSEE